MTEREVIPARLTLARKRRGLTMTALARLLGVQQRSVSGFEKGEFAPSGATLAAISRHLHFPVAFFFGDEPEVPETGSASFRSFAQMKACERDAALGAGAIALMLNDWIDERFMLQPAILPDMSGDDPGAAADSVRSQWGLGYRPIANMIHLLEHKGVRVFSLAEDTRAVDAFSFWSGDTPFVFLNTRKSAERSRFDAAHELGHLLLHRHGAPVGQDAEAEANAFASALLMPASSVYAKVRKTVTVQQLIRLKKIWIVSVAALAYRLRKLNIVSEWQYRTLCIQMGDYRVNEPEPAERETSQVLTKVFDRLLAEGISKSTVARDLNIPRAELENLIFGLSVTDGSGSRKGSSVNRDHLTVVK